MGVRSAIKIQHNVFTLCPRCVFIVRSGTKVSYRSFKTRYLVRQISQERRGGFVKAPANASTLWSLQTFIGAHQQPAGEKKAR